MDPYKDEYVLRRDVNGAIRIYASHAFSDGMLVFEMDSGGKVTAFRRGSWLKQLPMEYERLNPKSAYAEAFITVLKDIVRSDRFGDRDSDETMELTDYARGFEQSKRLDTDTKSKILKTLLHKRWVNSAVIKDARKEIVYWNDVLENGTGFLVDRCRSEGTLFSQLETMSILRDGGVEEHCKKNLRIYRNSLGSALDSNRRVSKLISKLKRVEA